MTWQEGPPPESISDGRVLLVVLSRDGLEERYDGRHAEYYDEPVTVAWWGSKGKTTWGHYCIVPDIVLRWAECPVTPAK